MKLKTGIPSYLEWFFGRAFAVVGALLLLAGLMFFAYQTFLYMDLGIWGKLPASSLFVEPTYPSDERQALKDMERQFPSAGTAMRKQLPESFRELVVYKKLDSIVPDWFRSKKSWLADPDHLYGLHNIVIWLLDFLSIPIFLALVGAIILVLSLRDLSRGTVPVGRKDAT